MKRVYLLVEGQTEETFVRELLVPHYSRQQMFVTPILVSTSPGHKGGVVSYSKVKPQITRLCRQDPQAHVSTMFDLYALPMDFPGRVDPAYPGNGSGQQKAAFLEQRLRAQINEPNFIPYLMVHEFEALLFSEPQQFVSWAPAAVVDRLVTIAGKYPTPEDINEQPASAPSKRILAAMREYEKPFHGPLIAADIGLDTLRRSCPHFHEWLKTLEVLPRQITAH